MRTPVELGSRRELLADDFLIDHLEAGARQVLHHPVPREAILVTDRPWEGCMGAFATVMKVGARYRLYYDSWHIDLSSGKIDVPRPPTICVAESADGLRWERVPVNLIDYPGSPHNNIVWMGAGDDYWGVHGFAPFLDDHPDCAPEARWKAFGAGWKKSHNGLYLMTSPDGIRWTLSPNKPVLAGFALDSHNTVRWSPADNAYRAFFRHWDKKVYSGLRIIMTAVSRDLVDWSEAVPLDYGNTPAEALYTNNVFAYPRAPHLWVGFPARYVEHPWDPAAQALPEREHRTLRAGVSKRYGSAVTDTQFMCGRDAVHFKRYPEAFVRPGLRPEGSWCYGDLYAAWGLIETPSDQPGAPDELSFFLTEHYWRGNGLIHRRYSIRPDGFVSVNGPMAGGTLLTHPFTFAGGRLTLNASASAAGYIRVELQEPDGRVIPGYSMDECWKTLGDSLELTVQWKGGADVSALAGKVLRLKVELRDADLFSFRFAP